MPARRISFVNFKGGVGKTSLVVNVAACLAHDLGQKVLLVDCDPQSNASIWLMGIARWNVINSMPGKSIYGAFLPDLPPVIDNIVPSVIRDDKGMFLIPNLDLLPATYELMELEESYRDNDGSPYYLRFYQHIRSVFSHYDYILFDCPPNLFRSSKCAIFASEEIYVPCHADKLSEVGLALLVTKIERFHRQTIMQQRTINGFRQAMIRGVVLNNVDGKANLSEPIKYMSLTIAKAKAHQIVSDDAEILSQQIKKAIFAARVVDSFRPVNIANGNQPIREDYLNLSRFIHNTPLSGSRKSDGTEKKGSATGRASRKSS